MRLLTEARPEEIRSLNAKVKSVDEVVVQNFNDNFEKIEIYNTCANYRATQNAQLTLKHLREVYPDLDIYAFEKEFGEPTRGQPNR